MKAVEEEEEEEEEEEDHLGQIHIFFFPAYVFGLYIFFGCGGNGVMLMFTYFGFWNSYFEVMIDDSFVRCYVGDELIISL